MAGLKTSNHPHNKETLVGGDILSLVTYGMYANPLAIYREYIQNSADAIASSGNPDNGKVEVTIDIKNRSVTIRDNGPGLSYKQASKALVSISNSEKQREHNRGFRGIGRLAGLAFGKSVTFLTRDDKQSPVTKVVWDGDRLRDGMENRLSAEEAIRRCVTIGEEEGDDYPPNFFEVKINAVSRYAATSIMNRNAVRNYLGETCPVPFDADFPYTSNICMFEESPMVTLDIRLDGEEKSLTRLFGGGRLRQRFHG